MAQFDKSTLTTESVEEKRGLQRHGIRVLPTLTSAALPSAAILWVHAENLSINPEAYKTLPPTVSRALAEPLIAEPFAVLMIIGAICLTVALFQIIRRFIIMMRDLHADAVSWFLICATATLEVPAVIGMVVLSQYTGEAWARQHDLGSYMLFSGHAFAIGFNGILIARLSRSHKAMSDPRMQSLRGLPVHAALTAILSFLFGASYLTVKTLPDFVPFLAHLTLTLTEMAVLLSFLLYFGRYWRFLISNADMDKR